VTAYINQSSAEQNQDVPLVLSETNVQKIAESFIDQTWEWASGKTTIPPTVGLTDVLQSSGISKENLAQITQMQQEVLKSMNDPEFQKQMTPEQKEQMNKFKNFSTNGSTFSIGPWLNVIKNTVQIFKYGIPLSAVFALISLVLILIISTKNSGRAVWMSFSFFSLSFGLFVLAGLYALPRVLIPLILSNMKEQGIAYGAGIFQTIFYPLSITLFHQHMALAVGAVCIALICFLSRFMVFKN
jgi:hypothetical protein